MPKVNDLYNTQIENYITSLIDKGEVKTGDRLPSERALGKMFNVSIMPVRQALLQLVNRGMLTRVPSKGTFVRTDKPTKAVTNRIGILYPQSESGFFASSYYTSILAGIDQEAKSEKKQLLLQSLFQEKYESPSKVIYDMMHDVDGLIFVDLIPNVFDQIKKTIKQIEVPTVVVNYEDSSDDINFVIADTREDVKKLITFLLDAGHTRIGCVYSYLKYHAQIHPTIANRIQAYQHTLRDKGITHSSEWICDFSDKDGIKNFIKKHKPTALFCTGDKLAMNLYELIYELGMRIPEDMSIVGCSNIKESHYAHPGLTTLDLSMETMGKTAVKRLSEMQREAAMGTTNYYTIAIPGKIVIRESYQVIST